MAYGPYSGPSIQDIIGATMRRYPVPPQPSSMMGRGDTMALSGLGPALSGAYANVQRLLLERKLQQEDLERRRQEAAAERQAQWAEEMRRMMMQRQWATEDRAALAQDPSQIRRREHEEWQMGQERRAPEIAAAAARMAHWRTYQPQQILSNPQLLSQYLRDFELSGGQPHPMRTRQVTETVPTPLPLVARTGAGAGIQPTTMQIPTGQVTEPIFPQVAEQTRLGDIVPGLRQKNPALAAMTVEDYKAKGGDIDTLIRLAEPKEPARVATQERIREKIAKYGLKSLTPGERQIYRDEIERRPPAGGAGETLASLKLQTWAKYLRDPDSLAPQERRLIGVDTGKPNAELQDVTAEERKARVKVNALRGRLTTPRDKTEEAIIRESLAAAEAELKQWQEIRNELTRPAGMSPSIGIGYEPRGGLRAGTLGTAEQRPPGGQQVVATLPPASSVPVGTEAMDNKTGKRFRSNGKRWVAVP